MQVTSFVHVSKEVAPLSQRKIFCKLDTPFYRLLQRELAKLTLIKYVLNEDVKIRNTLEGKEAYPRELLQIPC